MKTDNEKAMKLGYALACVVACLLCSGAANASVSDILAKMPAQSPAEGEALSQALVALGPEAVGEVCAAITPPATGGDVNARYALSGLAKYVTAPGREDARAMLSGEIVKALGAAADTEVKAFLIRQLQVAGKEECIDALSGYLGDEALCEPATQALLTIGTDNASKALLAALPTASGGPKLTLVKALGEIREEGALPTLTALAGDECWKTRELALFGLANIGDGASADVLARAAETGTSLEKARATFLYLLYAQRRAEAGKRRECAEICRMLIAARTSDEDVAVRSAALSTLVSAMDKFAVRDLLAAADSDSKEYRTAAYQAALSVNGKRASKPWVKKMGNASSEVRLEVLDMLSRRDDAVALDAVLDALAANGGAEEAAAARRALSRLPREEVRKIVASELPRMSPPAREALTVVVHPDDRASLESDVAAGAACAQECEEGFVALFNGKDLTGWVGDTKGYVAEDGRIVCKPGGNLYTDKEYADFVFRFEFRLTPGANNGLGIRAPMPAHAAYDGIELQILDDPDEQYKNIEPYQHHGSIYGVVPAKQGHLKPVGEWNYEEVVAKGRRIKVILNGVTIVDADIDEASANGTLDGKEHPGLKRTKGRLCFCGHGSVVEFRNLRIKEI